MLSRLLFAVVGPSSGDKDDLNIIVDELIRLGGPNMPLFIVIWMLIHFASCYQQCGFTQKIEPVWQFAILT